MNGCVSSRWVKIHPGLRHFLIWPSGLFSPTRSFDQNRRVFFFFFVHFIIPTQTRKQSIAIKKCYENVWVGLRDILDGAAGSFWEFFFADWKKSAENLSMMENIWERQGGPVFFFWAIANASSASLGNRNAFVCCLTIAAKVVAVRQKQKFKHKKIK